MKILFRVDGYRERGFGHIYRVKNLIGYLPEEHTVKCLSLKEHREGIDILQASGLEVIEMDDEEDMFGIVCKEKPDIVVMDVLNTEDEYMACLKDIVPRLVTIEDLGSGAEVADACINAIYEDQEDISENAYVGYRYMVLRKEFHDYVPHEVNEEVKHIFVMFGAADPLDLTHRIYDIACDWKDKEIEWDFVLGPAYDAGYMDGSISNIHVYQNIPSTSELVGRADIAITSQGTSIYESACVGTPSIVLAQNSRELLHTFACEENGFSVLGLGFEVSDDEIVSEINRLVADYDARREMHEKMVRCNVGCGSDRVISIILGES